MHIILRMRTFYTYWATPCPDVLTSSSLSPKHYIWMSAQDLGALVSSKGHEEFPKKTWYHFLVNAVIGVPFLSCLPFTVAFWCCFGSSDESPAAPCLLVLCYIGVQSDKAYHGVCTCLDQSVWSCDAGVAFISPFLICCPWTNYKP